MFAVDREITALLRRRGKNPIESARTAIVTESRSRDFGCQGRNQRRRPSSAPAEGSKKNQQIVDVADSVAIEVRGFRAVDG